MSEESKECWIRHFLNHRLVVALLSSIVFAITVSYLGAEFQRRNWIEQNRITTEQTLQEKIFDKRAEIIQKIFYNFAMQEATSWNILSAKIDKRNHLPYWEKVQEIGASQTAVLQEIYLYFGFKEKELIDNILKVHKIWHQINRRTSDTFITPETSKEIEKHINEKSKEAEKIRVDIKMRFYEIIYMMESESDNATSKKN